MSKLILFLLLPLLLNGLAWLANMDYLISVNFVLGGVTLALLGNAWKVLTRNEWKIFLGICGISNVITVLIEVIMLRLDSWGFTAQRFHLLGLTFLGAPIEEYNFWIYAPVLVCLAYLVLSHERDLSSPGFGEIFLSVLAARKLQVLEEDISKRIISKIVYIEDSVDGKYFAGSKIPTYVTIQLLLLATILWLRRYYHGSRQALALTTAVFFLTMMPYEQYAIRSGFWTYNAHRMLGIFFLDVPLEGWCMYFLPPVAGGMIIDVLSQRFFKKDI